MTLPAGSRVGRYEILAPLGAGGMGEVYRARDTRLDRDVALKLLPSAYANDPELRSRFEREARAASALNHAHIVVVFDCGIEDGQPYLAMELVDGVPFDAWIRERRPTVSQRLDVVMQMADALATAHAAGIVHRDVKPGNVSRRTGQRDEKEMMPIAAVSPDGKWLVYQVIVDGNVDLHAVPVDGGSSSVVVHTPGADYHPSFSPSGRWLYFQPDHRNLWRVPGPAQGWRQAPPEQVTNFPESGLWLEDPQVSFDGRALVYSRAHIESNLWLLRREKDAR